MRQTSGRKDQVTNAARCTAHRPQQGCGRNEGLGCTIGNGGGAWDIQCVLLALTAAYLPGTSVSSHQSSARGTSPIAHRKSRPASENRRNIGGEMLLRKRRPAVTCLLSTLENHLKGIIKNRSLAWPALSGRLVFAAAESRAKC